MNRNLDGICFRIKRNGKYESICFSDMTVEEQNSVLEHKDKQWLKRMCKILAQTIKDIGDEFDIIGGE
jgi:hypothetical protein